MGLPYRTALTIACVVLAVRYQVGLKTGFVERLHLWDVEAAGKVKLLVGSATVASFVLPAGLAWYITSVLTQLAVSLSFLLRMRAAD
jgi:hypothetical protein